MKDLAEMRYEEILALDVIAAANELRRAGLERIAMRLDEVAQFLTAEPVPTPQYVPGEDKGTVKILSDLLDRAYKMHVMAGTATYISAQDGDQNDPLLAWLSDVRSVLYGTTKPEPTMRRGGISGQSK